MVKHFLYIRTRLFLILLAPLLFLQCMDRPRNNPFDPDNNQSPVTLQLTPGRNDILLNWSFNRGVTDYLGFRLYRAVGTPENFTLFAEFPPDRFSFSDSTTNSGQWYYYKITVFGKDVESLPSNTGKAYLGPGEYWVLSEDGYILKKLSYDLINTLFHRDLYLRASEWSVAGEDSAIWLNYPQYTKSVSEFSMITGQEKLYYPPGLNYAVDVAFNSGNGYLYILDRGNANILVINRESVVEQIPLGSPLLYSKIKYHKIFNRLFLLGEEQLLSIALPGGQHPADTLVFPGGYTGQDFAAASNKAYILCASSSAQNSIIYTIGNNFVIEDTLNLGGIFYRLCFDEANQWFYAAQEIPAGDDFVVQLSLPGERQLQLGGFKYIEQIAVNPYDRSLIVVDYTNNLVSLFDKEGNFISSSKDFEGRKYLYLPARVYIQ